MLEARSTAPLWPRRGALPVTVAQPVRLAAVPPTAPFLMGLPSSTDTVVTYVLVVVVLVVWYSGTSARWRGLWC